MRIILLVLGVAACTPDDEPATVRRFHGATSGVELLLARTTSAAGAHLHGETRAILDDEFGGEPTRVVAFEDALLDGDGRLLSADLRQRVTLATTVIERRTVVDAAAGTVTLTRPGGTIVYHFDPDAAWAPVTLELSSILDAPLPSALACQVLGAAYRQPHPLLIDAQRAGFAQAFAGGAGPLPTLSYGVRCDYDGDDAVTALSEPSWGDIPGADSGDPTALVDRFEVAATPAVTAQECLAPARTEAFALDAADGRTLAGQLDLPAGDGPFPVVTFNAGTGGGDREGRFHGAPQWTCLSAALVAAGIAVARYDDPGHGESPGDFAELTFDDRDAHAAAIAAAVATHPAVDAARIFALGHSEGAAHVARAAQHEPAIAGLILVAGVGTTGGDVLVDQQGALLANAGYSPALVGAVREQQAAWVAAVRDGSLPDEALGGQRRTFWEQFVAFDGAADTALAARPTLVIQGGRDWQVPPANLDRIEAALRAASVEVQVVRAPALGHLLTAGAPGVEGIGEEYGMPRGFDEEVVAAIIGWVHEHGSGTERPH